jgi:hypothetical protein
MQYSFSVSGGHNVSISVSSPTGDNFYDAGTILTASTAYIWGIINNDTRQSLLSFTIDSVSNNVTREVSGIFTTPNIEFMSPNSLTFISVTQYLIGFQFKDSTGSHSISPSSVEIELDDPTILLVPPSGTWLDSGTTFQLYQVQWEGIDVMPTNQTKYTVSSPIDQLILDRVYTGSILVTDYLGLPISGAKVTITLENGTTLASTTGSNGSVALREIPIGGYNATVSYLGSFSSIRGDAALASSLHVTLFASYPTFAIMAALLISVLAIFLVAVRRRSRRSMIVPVPISTDQPQRIEDKQAQEVVCPACGGKNTMLDGFCHSCGKQLQ